MISKKGPVFHTASGSGKKVRDSSADKAAKIKEMRDRDFRKRQKREHDIEIERRNHEQTY